MLKVAVYDPPASLMLWQCCVSSIRKHTGYVKAISGFQFHQRSFRLWGRVVRSFLK